MSHDDPIRISHSDLFSDGVEEALAERRTRSGRMQSPPPVSPLRALLLSAMFYIPAASTAGALVAWQIIEPWFDDFSVIGGEVTLIDDDPFDVLVGGGIKVTIGPHAALVFPGGTDLEPGVDGQPAYGQLSEIRPGDHVEVVGLATGPAEIAAMAVRPATPERAAAARNVIVGAVQWSALALFPLTAAFITLFIFLSEAFATRNWVRFVQRGLPGTGLAALFALAAFIPASLFVNLVQPLLEDPGAEEAFFVTAANMTPTTLMAYVVHRSIIWTLIGAGLGLGMNLTRSTKVQVRNTMMGGALGGAIGGLFFDPIDRFFPGASLFDGSEVSRAVGLCAVGLCIGIFVALGERLSREAWVRVRTGPLAGKSFVLYRTPTILGSAPQADIYLFKDAEIDPRHAAIHRVGTHHEVEDLGSRHGTRVGGDAVRRQRLVSGDSIVLGGTVLEFEERARRRSLRDMTKEE